MQVNSSKMNFRDTVMDILENDYLPDVIRVTTDVIPDVAKEAAARLRKTAPRGKRKKYAKGWTHKVEHGRLRVVATVYGKKGTYQLAHLLEHGHVTRNGSSRTFAPTPAHPHIAQVDEWAANEAYNRIMRKLEGLA